MGVCGSKAVDSASDSSDSDSQVASRKVSSRRASHQRKAADIKTEVTCVSFEVMQSFIQQP